MKVWYIAMLYLAFAGIIWGCILLICGICTSIPKKMIETFNNCSFAIIAALIATRGWLMSEEQVMKKISNWYTTIIVLWVVLIMSLSFISYEKSVNTDVFHNSLPHKIVDSSIAKVFTNDKLLGSPLYYLIGIYEIIKDDEEYKEIIPSLKQLIIERMKTSHSFASFTGKTEFVQTLLRTDVAM